MIAALLDNPLMLFGLILLAGAMFGDLAERARIPWITGCILAGVLLGPGAGDILRPVELTGLGGFTQAALAVIAFNIGCHLVPSRLREVGWAVLALAGAQLLAPFILVLAGQLLLGTGIAAALVLAAVATATAPTTTYALLHRQHATGLFAERVLGVLALNDAAAVLTFSVVSSAAVAAAASDAAPAAMTAALVDAATAEGCSLLVGAALGGLYLVVNRWVEDATPGAEARSSAALLAMLLLGGGIAVVFSLSHLLVPLSLGLVVANGAGEAGRAHVQGLLRPLEEPLFMVFFILAGAELPLAAVEQLPILAAAAIYLLGRFLGKDLGIYLAASALRLDRPTRRYLGLCFPSQGALAMGLLLAFVHSPAVIGLPESAAGQFRTAASVVLVGVLLSQLFGPLLIDFAIRRGQTPDATTLATR